MELTSNQVATIHCKSVHPNIVIPTMNASFNLVRSLLHSCNNIMSDKFDLAFAPLSPRPQECPWIQSHDINGYEKEFQILLYIDLVRKDHPSSAQRVARLCSPVRTTILSPLVNNPPVFSFSSILE